MPAIESLHALDWVVVAILALSTLFGAGRGLIRTVCGMAGWIVGAILAIRHGATVGAQFTWAHEAVRTALGMAAIVMGALVIAALTGALLHKLVRMLGLRTGDYLLGAFFGLARGLIVVLVAADVAMAGGLDRTESWRESVTAPSIVGVVEQVRPWLATSGIIEDVLPHIHSHLP